MLFAFLQFYIQVSISYTEMQKLREILFNGKVLPLHCTVVYVCECRLPALNRGGKSLSRSGRFTPEERAHGAHINGGWVCHSASVDTCHRTGKYVYLGCANCAICQLTPESAHSKVKF
jgi:hypothetical protein